MNRLLQDLMRFESSGKNVTNERQSTSSGRARGFFQITDGTWRDHARKAGVDLTQYPTAITAPYQVQLAVAKLIPFGRWDPITLRRLSAAGHKFDTRKTLGENLAAAGETGEPGSPGAPLPAASAVVTGAGQPRLDYASPDKPIPGATQPNYFPEGTEPGLASAFDGALGGDAGAGSAGGGSSGGGSIPPGDQFSLSPGDASANALPSGAIDMSQLASLFTLPTIGQAERLKPPQPPKEWI